MEEIETVDGLLDLCYNREYLVPKAICDYLYDRLGTLTEVHMTPVPNADVCKVDEENYGSKTDKRTIGTDR